MKRSAIVRKTSMPRSSKPLARTTKLAPLNRKRMAKRTTLHFGAQAALCRQMPCSSCGSSAPSQAHHEPSRAAGGTDTDTVPLCATCHHLRHWMGRATFWSKSGADPEQIKSSLREMVARGITMEAVA
jgi:hypothetical protein